MDYLILIIGFVVLLVSGDFLVRGGVSLARHFRISTLVVGLTVVSLGTSAPELMVSLKAALTNQADFATGTVIGSNISNIALVLGLTAIVLPLAVNRRSTIIDWPIMFGAVVLFFLFIVDHELARVEGLIFVFLLAGFIFFSIYQSRRKSSSNQEEVLPAKYSLWLSLLIILVAIIGLRFGANWLVKGASGIAKSFGISDYLISVSIIAFGTSVPELATSLIAAVKRETDISIGNIIGSNLFNILGILGVTALIKPISVNDQILEFDIYWLAALCFLLLFMMLPLKSGRINRWNGVILVVSYLIYLMVIFSGKL
ncbi:MAG: calcium/sodium antiporter [Bacteroidales bacterium]|nr:calcium/sodium antiporter [Bacteroidales bacterium]